MSYSNISANNQCFKVLYLQRFIRLLAEFLPEKKTPYIYLDQCFGRQRIKIQKDPPLYRLWNMTS